MSKMHKFLKHRSQLERRMFLKNVLAAATGSGVFLDLSSRLALADMITGNHLALGQETQQKIFCSFEFRDQWDWLSAFIAPGLRKDLKIIGNDGGAPPGEIAAYLPYETITNKHGHQFHVTELGKVLADQDPKYNHFDNLVIMETGEVTQGRIHGHEAGNPIRSPGCSLRQMDQSVRMWEYTIPDYKGEMNGNEPIYTRVPTIACVHNHEQLAQASLTQPVRPGIQFRGMSRLHTAYHHPVDLETGALVNLFDKSALYDYFLPKTQGFCLEGDRLSIEECQALLSFVEAMGKPYSERLNRSGMLQFKNALELGFSVGNLKTIDFKSIDDLDEWKNIKVPGASGKTIEIPDQVYGKYVKAQIYEQLRYAAAIAESGACRTMSFEFDYVDFHGVRDRKYMETLAKQGFVAFKKFFDHLVDHVGKENIVVAIFSTDGSRSPITDSDGLGGRNGRNVAMLWGDFEGRYVGDIERVGGGNFRYSSPKAGQKKYELVSGTRLPGAVVWQTMLKSLGLHGKYSNRWSDASAAPLEFIFK